MEYSSDYSEYVRDDYSKLILKSALSPKNHPEHIDIAGIVAKSLEIALAGIIVYVINFENKLKQRSL